MNTIIRTISAFALAALALLFTACPDTNTPCACAVKLHGSAPCACGGSDCGCKQKEYALYGGKTLEDTTGLITSANIAKLNEILKDYDILANYLFVNINKIIVIMNSIQLMHLDYIYCIKLKSPACFG